MKTYFTRKRTSIMYKSFICLHTNYGILLWRHQDQEHRLFKLQKRPVRIVSLGKYNAHTSPMTCSPARTQSLPTSAHRASSRRRQQRRRRG